MTHDTSEDTQLLCLRNEDFALNLSEEILGCRKRSTSAFVTKNHQCVRNQEETYLLATVLLQYSITTVMAEGTNTQEDLIEKNSVQFVPSSFNVHTFSDKILDTDVFFQVLKMSESFYIWIGKSNRFGEFSVAMTVKEKQPSSTVLIGGNASETVTLAEKLSKKTGKQVFVGGELDNFSHLELPLVEKRIAEEMKSNSDKFL